MKQTYLYNINTTPTFGLDQLNNERLIGIYNERLIGIYKCTHTYTRIHVLLFRFVYVCKSVCFHLLHTCLIKTFQT